VCAALKNALAEQDDAKRNRMLRAADRLLKCRTGNGEWGTVENPGHFAQPKTSDRIAGKELTEPKKQLLEERLFDERPTTQPSFEALFILVVLFVSAINGIGVLTDHLSDWPLVSTHRTRLMMDTYNAAHPHARSAD
jgi:hypothetical protein